jgi:hypothetical protein
MGNKDARKALREARNDLERVSRADGKRHRAAGGRGNVPESDAYLAANDRVIDAEKALPWWRRF